MKHFRACRKQSHPDLPSGLILANPSITCIDISPPHHLHHYLAVNASYSFVIDLVSSFLGSHHPWYLPFTSPPVNILLTYLPRSVSNSHPLMQDSTKLLQQVNGNLHPLSSNQILCNNVDGLECVHPQPVPQSVDLDTGSSIILSDCEFLR